MNMQPSGANMRSYDYNSMASLQSAVDIRTKKYESLQHIR